ncbi:MAG: hypothetical protein IPP72_15345 [Chitinophagaceae bacterium]|nr:hypothetical protein [Chitinophagaceae bacterium]
MRLVQPQPISASVTIAYTWNSQVFNSAGTYADTLIGSSGCDSISTLILIVKAVSSSAINITVCPAQLPL